MSAKRVLAIHDLCSFGRCSLTAAIPVISVLGSQVCPFPTAVFSNNLTYGEFTSTDLTQQMPGLITMWKKLNFHYDAVYSGFLAGPAQVDLVKETIDRFASADSLTVVPIPPLCRQQKACSKNAVLSLKWVRNKSLLRAYPQLKASKISAMTV